MAKYEQVTKDRPSQALLPPYPHSSVSTVLQNNSLTIIAIFAFLLLGSVFLNLFVVFGPRLPDFFVTDATLSLLNSSSNQLMADCVVKVTIFNGNKNFGVNFENIRVAIGYEDEPLANTSLPSFYQEKLNTATIPVHLVSPFATVSKSSQLKSGARSKGKVYLLLRSSVQFKGGPYPMRWHSLKVDCPEVEIDWPPPPGAYPLVGRLNSVYRCAAHCY